MNKLTKKIVIDVIAGARPNFIKIAPIIKAIIQKQSQGCNLSYRLVHTGQHYDPRMSQNFFEQLGIPEPDVNLEVGSGSQAEQTALLMVRYEELLLKQPCDLCLVVGDVTSTMACSIVAKKQCIKVAHVEGGLRSGDLTMPEEINRIVTDSISDYFFTTSEVANQNLQQNGISADRIFFVGNTMIDTLHSNLHKLIPPHFWDEYHLEPAKYFVLTLHRPANVDNVDLFVSYLNTICNNAHALQVIFPAHPRNSKILKTLTTLPNNLRIVDPQPYLEFNYLVKHAKAVITDSGGVTEETTVMGVPCLTLRNSTERPETVSVGTNVLVGTDVGQLKPYIEDLFAGKWKNGTIPVNWDGKTSVRIVDILEKLLCH